MINARLPGNGPAAHALPAIAEDMQNGDVARIGKKAIQGVPRVADPSHGVYNNRQLSVNLDILYPGSQARAGLSTHSK